MQPLQLKLMLCLSGRVFIWDPFAHIYLRIQYLTSCQMLCKKNEFQTGYTKIDERYEVKFLIDFSTLIQEITTQRGKMMISSGDCHFRLTQALAN